MNKKDEVDRTEKIAELAKAKKPLPSIKENSGGDLANKLADVIKSNAYLFRDQNNDAYAKIETRIIKISSKDFQAWIAKVAYEKMSRALPSTEIVKKVILLLTGIAKYGDQQHTLEVRTAWHESALWYDLGNGKAVKITSKGWAIVSEVPIIFRCFGHQRPQVEPKNHENIQEIFDFLNFPSAGGITPSQLLFLVWLIEAFIPGFPHAIAAVHGREGSGKSTIGKIAKSCVDPSILETQSLPKNIAELSQQLSHHWLLHLDNLSRISKDMSDNLCKAVTGQGFGKRELYSDDDDIIYSFKRVLILNGINQIVENSDLLDRSLLLEVQRIKENKSENDFWSHFEQRKPYILGSIFNVISAAMRVIDQVNVSQFRMADMARWGVAITLALGLEEKNFTDALEMNVQRRHEEAIDANLVAQILRAYMEHRAGDMWETSPTEMHHQLKSHAENLMQIDTRTFPKEANWLWKALERAQTNLEAFGIYLSRSRNDQERFIRVEKRQQIKNAENAVSTVNNDTNDSTDSKSLL